MCLGNHTVRLLGFRSDSQTGKTTGCPLEINLTLSIDGALEQSITHG